MDPVLLHALEVMDHRAGLRDAPARALGDFLDGGQALLDGGHGAVAGEEPHALHALRHEQLLLQLAPQLVDVGLVVAALDQPVFRPAEAERWLAGKPATAETAKQAAVLAQEEAQPRDSLLRCAREYREAMVGVLVQSTLAQAIAAANPTPGGAI